MAVAEDDEARPQAQPVFGDVFAPVDGAHSDILEFERYCGGQAGQRAVAIDVSSDGMKGRDRFERGEQVGITHVTSVEKDVTAAKRFHGRMPEKTVGVGEDAETNGHGRHATKAPAMHALTSPGADARLARTTARTSG